MATVLLVKQARYATEQVMYNPIINVQRGNIVKHRDLKLIVQQVISVPKEHFYLLDVSLDIFRRRLVKIIA